LTKNYKEKYSGLNPVSKFVHKNTGFIVMGISVLVIFYAWTLYTDDQEFFSSWSCSKLYGYMITESNYGYPDHKDLTEELHLKLHTIYANECTTDEEWQQELDNMKLEH
jgi:hypothetical protein